FPTAQTPNASNMVMVRIRSFQPIQQLYLSPRIAFNHRTTVCIRNYSVHQAPSEPSSSSRPKVTLANLRKMYMTGQKIAVMTAYDFPSGTFADQAGSDIILVGDSLGMVCLGYES